MEEDFNKIIAGDGESDLRKIFEPVNDFPVMKKKKKKVVEEWNEQTKEDMNCLAVPIEDENEF